MTFRYLAAMIPLLLAAGCATAPDPQVVDQKETCEKTARTGSTIVAKDCSAPMTEAERQSMLDGLRDKMKSTPVIGKQQ